MYVYVCVYKVSRKTRAFSSERRYSSSAKARRKAPIVSWESPNSKRLKIKEREMQMNRESYCSAIFGGDFISRGTLIRDPFSRDVNESEKQR